MNPTSQSHRSFAVSIGSFTFGDAKDEDFSKGGAARSIIAVAGVPGHALLEINCIAAVSTK